MRRADVDVVVDSDVLGLASTLTWSLAATRGADVDVDVVVDSDVLGLTWSSTAT
jgi:hypothetical protein